MRSINHDLKTPNRFSMPSKALGISVIQIQIQITHGLN